jgi:hypothetical protein
LLQTRHPFFFFLSAESSYHQTRHSPGKISYLRNQKNDTAETKTGLLEKGKHGNGPAMTHKIQSCVPFTVLAGESHHVNLEDCPCGLLAVPLLALSTCSGRDKKNTEEDKGA